MLLVLLPVPLSIVPLYNVSEKWGPGLACCCCRSGGAYWPARLSGRCLFFREIAAA